MASDTLPPDGTPSVDETVIEALLFVAAEPVALATLARVLACDEAALDAALLRLAQQLQLRGIRLQRLEADALVTLVTAPAAAAAVERLLGVAAPPRLSTAALETLAVVAYRQPVTRAQIEAVRGVDCSGVLRSLLQRGLVEEVGRMDSPGRPVLYGVSDLFMRHFGLTGLHELPPLANEENSRIDEIISIEENPPSV